MRERKLRETVVRASGCLDDLSSAQRKVLSARAGLGAAPPRSRAAVAKRFDITVKRVVRLERTGLQRLRSLAGRGACTPPAAPSAPTATLDTVTSGTTAAPATAVTDVKRTPQRERSSKNKDETQPRSGGGTDTPSGKQGGVAGVTQTNTPGGPGSLDLTIPVILLALLVLAVMFARLRRREAEPVVAGTEEAPARPTWVPWHKSTMTGPSWNDTPPEIEREREQPADEYEPWEPPRSRTRR